MLLFCPTCGMMMQIEEGSECHRFACHGCGFSYPISSRVYPKLKDLDEVLGGPTAWENAQVTDEICPKCSNSKAYFMQLQTRSADEPMTIFYRCTDMDCAHRWKE